MEKKEWNLCEPINPTKINANKSSIQKFPGFLRTEKDNHYAITELDFGI